MAASTSNPFLGAIGIVVARKKPGHFVALTRDGRVDATLTQSGTKLAEALERHAPLGVGNVMKGSSDGKAPLLPVVGAKTIDPSDVSVAMPAADGEPVVTEAERNAWKMYRVTYEVTLTVTPFTVSGLVMLMPTLDPEGLPGRGAELFVPVFDPTVQVNGVTIADAPRDAVLVNRAHIQAVKATRR